MSRSTQKYSMWSTIGGLGWPLILGSILTVGFFALMYQGPLNLPILHRYFAGHPVSIVETALFYVGIVALALKFWEVSSQFSSLGSITLGEGENQPVSKVGDYLDQLAGLSSSLRNTYLGKRLAEALGAVERKGTAEGLDAELKYLSDLDIGKQQDSYALVRIIIWATPMLGFLGTVMGITQALGDLANQDMGNLKGAMAGLLSGLYVAFDTTAIGESYAGIPVQAQAFPADGKVFLSQLVCKHAIQQRQEK